MVISIPILYIQMAKHLKTLLSRGDEDGTTVDYVENLLNPEDGLTTINDSQLFVGSYPVIEYSASDHNSFALDHYRIPNQGSLLLLWIQNLQDNLFVR